LGGLSEDDFKEVEKEVLAERVKRSRVLPKPMLSFAQPSKLAKKVLADQNAQSRGKRTASQLSAKRSRLSPVREEESKAKLIATVDRGDRAEAREQPAASASEGAQPAAPPAPKSSQPSAVAPVKR